MTLGFIVVEIGDITRMAVDAIVNAAKPTLLGGVTVLMELSIGPRALAYWRNAESWAGAPLVRPGLPRVMTYRLALLSTPLAPVGMAASMTKMRNLLPATASPWNWRFKTAALPWRSPRSPLAFTGSRHSGQPPLLRPKC
jgi:hypothetical protein